MAVETRWVVVGYGMGATHAQLIEQVPGLRLLGVCDIDKAKRDRAVSEHRAIRVYSAFADVLKDSEVDGVVIVTPHCEHARMAIQAMDAGKHTITDKAMCLTTVEAHAMIEARDRNNVLLSTFHNRRWDPDFLTVRKVLQAGLLGRIHHIQSCVTSWGHWDGWRTERRRMGGWLYDWGAHTLDQVLVLAGEAPRSVYAYVHYRDTDPCGVEDYVNCNVTFESGLTATTIISYLSRIPMPRWYILGEEGTLECTGFDTPVRVRTVVSGVEADVSVPLEEGTWRSFYDNIAGALAGKETLAVQPEQVVPQIEVAECAYRSIESQQAVRVS